MLQTQPVLSSPKAYRPAQQLGTPSSQPWEASSQDRQLVTTTLGQGRSLFGELLNIAVTENLAKGRNPSLLRYPNPSGQDGQRSRQPSTHSCPFPDCPQLCAISIPPCPRQSAGHQDTGGVQVALPGVPQSTGRCRAPGPGSHRDTPLVTRTPKTEQLC